MVNAILAMIGVIGFAITLLTLFPRLTVSNDAAIDPTDPFSTPFVVSNEGYLPLYSVQFFVGINNVALVSGGGMEKFRVTMPEWKIKRLSPAEQFSLYAGRVIGAHGGVLSSADVVIIVEYRPFLFPFTKQRFESRFVTLRGPDDHLHWMHRPLVDGK